jgi:hypothetical protein
MEKMGDSEAPTPSSAETYIELWLTNSLGDAAVAGARYRFILTDNISIPINRHYRRTLLRRLRKVKLSLTV